MPVAPNRQNSSTHAMSLKELAIPIAGGHQSSIAHHQVNSRPTDLTLTQNQNRQNEQFRKQQQQNYFLQQQQQQQMQMLQQQTRLYGNQMYTNQQELVSGDSPLVNFQKNDPLLSTSTNQQFDETMMDGVN